MNKRTIAWVNRYRAKYDVGPPLTELPKGQPGSTVKCPVARAIEGQVTKHRCYSDPQDHGMLLPQYVKDAIRRFDHGKYPELLENP